MSIMVLNIIQAIKNTIKKTIYIDKNVNLTEVEKDFIYLETFNLNKDIRFVNTVELVKNLNNENILVLDY